MHYKPFHEFFSQNSQLKDFSGWTKEKEYIHANYTEIHFSKREIWWCALGINIGVEIDGKNHQYERPVLVLKHGNKNMAFIIPITTKNNDPKTHIPIYTNNMTSFAKISQGRTISSKRLLRKIDILPEDQFLMIRQKFFDYISL